MCSVFCNNVHMSLVWCWSINQAVSILFVPWSLLPVLLLVTFLNQSDTLLAVICHSDRETFEGCFFLKWMHDARSALILAWSLESLSADAMNARVHRCRTLTQFAGHMWARPWLWLVSFSSTTSRKSFWTKKKKSLEVSHVTALSKIFKAFIYYLITCGYMTGCLGQLWTLKKIKKTK